MDKLKKIFPEMSRNLVITKDRIYDNKLKGSVPINSIAYMIISKWDGKTSLDQTAKLIVEKYSSVNYSDIAKDVYKLYSDLNSLKLLNNFNRKKIVIFKEYVELADSYKILRIIHVFIKQVYSVMYTIHNFYFRFLSFIVEKE